MDNQPGGTARLSASGLELETHVLLEDFSIDAPLTLLYTGRESSATTTMLTLAGRTKPRAGSVLLTTADGEELGAPRERAKRIALAGVNEIDSLDRGVTVRSLVRESVAWSSQWYQRTPRDISNIPRWVELSELLSFPDDPSNLVGQLPPAQRFILRVILSLLVRTNPEFLLIDDIDQVHSLEIRAELLAHLSALSKEFPVVVASSNPDISGQCDDTITLRSEKEQP